MSDADTNLLDSWEEKRVEGGFTRIVLGGSGHCAAIVNVVADNYNRVSGREKPTLEDLQEHLNEKVTLIYSGRNQFGAGMIKSREGTLVDYRGNVAMLPKRSRVNGWRVDPDSVLDMLPGYDAKTAAELVAGVRAHYPVLTEIDHDRLCQLPEWSADDHKITLCAFGTWRMPDCTATDAIQLIATYDKESDVCDGGVLLIRPEFGISEHGSCYGRQVIRDFGEVVGFEPITFREAIELCNMDFDEAASRVLPSGIPEFA